MSNPPASSFSALPAAPFRPPLATQQLVLSDAPLAIRRREFWREAKDWFSSHPRCLGRDAEGDTKSLYQRNAGTSASVIGRWMPDYDAAYDHDPADGHGTEVRALPPESLPASVWKLGTFFLVLCELWHDYMVGDQVVEDFLASDAPLAVPSPRDSRAESDDTVRLDPRDFEPSGVAHAESRLNGLSLLVGTGFLHTEFIEVTKAPGGDDYVAVDPAFADSVVALYRIYDAALNPLEIEGRFYFGCAFPFAD